jgi:hypothetical protein
METTGDSLGQTPAGVLMLRQLEAATDALSHEKIFIKINSKELIIGITGIFWFLI